MRGTGAEDVVLTRHSILRNHPILGCTRFFLESVRPEVQQYFTGRNVDGRPFDRDMRSCAGIDNRVDPGDMLTAPPRTWADDWEPADPGHFGPCRPGPGKVERRDDPAAVHPDRPGAAADPGAAGRPEGSPGEDS